MGIAGKLVVAALTHNETRIWATDANEVRNQKLLPDQMQKMFITTFDKIT
jgi:hypothetical protein